jgi:hypothetical protein
MSSMFVEVHAGIRFETEPVRMIEVALTYGDQRFDGILDYDNRRLKAEFAYDETAGRTIGYSFTAYMISNERYLQSAAPSFTSVPAQTEASIIVIDPRQLYRLERPAVYAIFPFDKYSAAFVDLRATSRSSGAEIAVTLDLRPERLDMVGSLVVDSKAPIDLAYRVRHVAKGTGVIEGPWLPLEQEAIVVGEPAAAGIGSPLA